MNTPIQYPLTFILFLIFSTLSVTAQDASVLLDGTTGYVDLGKQYDFTQDSTFTIEMWFKTSDASGVNQLITKMDPDQNYKGWGMQVEDGTIRFYLLETYGSNEMWLQNQTDVVDDGEWHHVAIVYDGLSSVDMYLDGKSINAVQTGTLTGNIQNDVPVILGAFLDNGSPEERFGGFVDEVRIWNTARTMSQISDNMNCPVTGTEQGLIGYWNLEEGSDTFTIDQAGNKQGTLMGGASWSTDVGMDCAAGISERSKNLRTNIYPNPANGNFLISFDRQLSNASIEIFDCDGRMVKIINDVNGSNYQLELNNCTSGLYTLRLTTSEGLVSTQKLILMK